MSVERMPFFADSTSYRYTLAIDGTNYIFDFVWCERFSRWILGIYDVEGNPIRTGIRIVEAWPLNARDIIDAMPPAILSCIRNDERRGDPTRRDVAENRITLALITGADIVPTPTTEDPEILKITETTP